MKPSLDEIYRSHGQSPNSWSCTVSGLEFAAKFYGILPLNSHPLQENPENERKGFADTSLLDELGLQGDKVFLSPESALTAIETETNQGRVVAVALLLFPTDGSQSAYHIHIAAPKGGALVLIDPANGQEICSTKSDVAKVLSDNSRDNPFRKDIEILTLLPKSH